MNSSESYFQYKSNNDDLPCFIVENITHLKGEPKVIKIFNYPILPGNPSKGIPAGTRDLILLPGVSVDNIEESLMHGTLRYKIIAKDIRIKLSNISLIQFNEKFKTFLADAGIEEGVELTYDGYVTATLPYTWKMNVPLIGIKNGVNRIFTTPDKFICGLYENNEFVISIFHNGRRLNKSSNEFSIEKSDSRNEDFDTIKLITFKPNENSTLVANYVVRI